MNEQLDMNPEESPFEFPSRFPIKVMGEVDTGVEDLVKATLDAELEDKTDIEIENRLSSGGKYISVTATFNANSKAELDRIYQILSKHEKVKYMV